MRRSQSLRTLVVLLVACVVAFPVIARAKPPASSMESRVAALEALVAQQQSKIQSLEAENASCEASITALQDEVEDIGGSSVMALAPYLSVTTSDVNGVVGPHVIFTGANLHLRSGSGSTKGAVNGLGNLIVGYDGEGSPEPNWPWIEWPLAQDDMRRGSHNIIIGDGHNWMSYGGFVSGEDNLIMEPSTFIGGGYYNRALASYSSILGAGYNETWGFGSTISGGYYSSTSGRNASVSGGCYNRARGDFSSVSGGISNHAAGPYSAIGGGWQNRTGGFYSSIAGGASNEATGEASSVSGGTNRQALGPNDWWGGGLFQDE